MWKSRPGPSFVPAPFSIRPLHSVKSCWIFFLGLNWFLCLFARWWITGCTFKDACSDAETAKHDFLGFTPLTHAPECCNIKFTILFCSQEKQTLDVSRCITECLLKEMQPVVNIYAKGGTQNELPFFSNRKIIVIRLSVVRSAVLCFLNPWSVQDSFNEENMSTHATHSWPHQ